jgi:hypothetical protein
MGSLNVRKVWDEHYPVFFGAKSGFGLFVQGVFKFTLVLTNYLDFNILF